MSTTKLIVLSPAERTTLLNEAFRLLEDTGLEVQSSSLRQKLKKAGAVVDPADRVRFPRQAMEELIAQVPQTQVKETISGRRLQLGAGERLNCSIVLDPMIVDYREGPRPPRLSDVSRHAVLGDALPLINATYKMDQGVEGLSPDASNVRTILEFLCHTTNHVIAAPANLKSLATWIRFMEVVLDGRSFEDHPIFTVALHAKTPLRLPAFEGDEIETAVARGIPLHCGSCPMAGATAPITLAGTVLLTLAESLFLLAAVQAVGPGHPVMAANVPFVFNLKTGNISAGAAETALLATALSQTFKDLGLLTGGILGYNDPSTPDFQVGAEAMLTTLAAVHTGADMLSGFGTIGNANGVSAEKMVLDHDLLELAERFQQGITVDAETLAAAAIRQAGPGGNFMDSPHTLKYVHGREHYYGGSFAHQGRISMLEAVHERVETLLASHHPTVPERRRQALRILAESL